MADLIQFRRDTAERWRASNPILAEGELGLILDSSNQWKIGDGVRHWNDLPLGLSNYDGNIFDKLGYDFEGVISQGGMTNILRNIVTNRSQILLSQLDTLTISEQGVYALIKQSGDNNAIGHLLLGTTPNSNAINQWIFGGFSIENGEISENNGKGFSILVRNYKNGLWSQWQYFQQKFIKNGKLGVDAGEEWTYGHKAIDTLIKNVSAETSGNIEEIEKTVETINTAITELEKRIDDISKSNASDKLSRVSDDAASGIITFEKGIKFGTTNDKKSIDKNGNANLKTINSESVINSGNFQNNGNIQNQYGKITTQTLEVLTNTKTKNLTVTGKATFFELEVQKASAAGGLSIYSAGAGKIDLVEPIYSTENTTEVTGWKCYQLAKDADGVFLQQMFKEGDNLVSFSFNTGVGYYTGVANRWWWRRCTAAGFAYVLKNGQRYISFTVSKRDCAEGSDEPQVGDKVCVLGNRSDIDRQKAIIISAYGGLDAGLIAPYIAQYTGINDFDLASHRKSHWGYDAMGNPDNKFIGNFAIQGNGGTDTPLVRDLGEWQAGTYYYYDRVSYKGSLYLMTNKASGTTTDVPGVSTDWALQVAKGAQGDAGMSINLKGNAIAHYTIDTGSNFDEDGLYLLDKTADGLGAVVASVAQGNVSYITPEEGDSYITSSDGHLWTYGNVWIDCGVIKGEKGDKGETGSKGADGKDGAKGADGVKGADGADAVIYQLVPNAENVTLFASGSVVGALNYSVYLKKGDTLTLIELSNDVYWRWKTENSNEWSAVKTEGNVPISYDFANDASENIVVTLIIDGIIQDTRIVRITANNDAFMGYVKATNSINVTVQRQTKDISNLTQSSLQIKAETASLSSRMGKAEAKIETSVQTDGNGKIITEVKLSADQIDLSGSVTANNEFRIDRWGNVMTGTQYGISTTKYIVEDKSNLIFTSNTQITLPNDPEYIGRKIMILSHPKFNSEGVVVDGFPFITIKTAEVFTRGVYGTSIADGAEIPDTIIEQIDQVGSPFAGVRYFGGNVAYDNSGVTQMPKKLIIQGGYVELLGVEYSTARTFRSETPKFNNEFYRVHMARIDDEGVSTTEEPYSWVKTIDDTDADNGSIDVFPSTTALQETTWEHCEKITLWTVINVDAKNFTYE